MSHAGVESILSNFQHLRPGDHRAPCPQCDRGPRDRALSLHVEHERVVFHCFRCGWSGAAGAGAPSAGGRSVSSTCRRSGGSTRPRFEQLSDFGRKLWESCRPIAGIAQSYLQARGCAIPPADGDLRWHARLRHPVVGVEAPALVGLVRDVLTGRPLTLHRTWIRADGRKADVSPPRMLLGRHRKQGGAVMLWPHESVTRGLAIAEGVETALALAHAVTPAWALVDAGNVASFPLIAGIEVLTIAVDHDDAGVRAARECARRWAPRDVRVVMAAQPGADLADVAMSSAT